MNKIIFPLEDFERLIGIKRRAGAKWSERVTDLSPNASSPIPVRPIMLGKPFGELALSKRS